MSLLLNVYKRNFKLRLNEFIESNIDLVMAFGRVEKFMKNIYIISRNSEQYMSGYEVKKSRLYLISNHKNCMLFDSIVSWSF